MEYGEQQCWDYILQHQQNSEKQGELRGPWVCFKSLSMEKHRNYKYVLVDSDQYMRRHT